MMKIHHDFKKLQVELFGDTKYQFDLESGLEALSLHKSLIFDKNLKILKRNFLISSNILNFQVLVEL